MIVHLTNNNTYKIQTSVLSLYLSSEPIAQTFDDNCCSTGRCMANDAVTARDGNDNMNTHLMRAWQLYICIPVGDNSALKYNEWIYMFVSSVTIRAPAPHHLFRRYELFQYDPSLFRPPEHVLRPLFYECPWIWLIAYSFVHYIWDDSIAHNQPRNYRASNWITVARWIKINEWDCIG